MIRIFSQIQSSDFDVPKTNLGTNSFETILQMVFALAAAVAVVVLMLASLRYVTSQGDPAAVAKAKNAIIYAIIGLAVAASAFSIVGFVVKSL